MSLALDRYIPGHSPVHRLDARLKLGAVMAFVLVTTTVPPRSGPALLLLTALALGLVGVARLPFPVVFRRSAVALPFAGMAALSVPCTSAGQVLWAWSVGDHTWTVTDAGLLLGGSILLKAWLAVLLSGVLIATTPFPQVVRAAQHLRLPPLLATTIAFMYRYIFVLVDEAHRLLTARAARSTGRGRTVWWRAQVLGGMVGSLFIRSYERSERIYAAMLARGYAGELCALAELSWTQRDTWYGVLWAGLLVGIAILGRVSG